MFVLLIIKPALLPFLLGSVWASKQQSHENEWRSHEKKRLLGFAAFLISPTSSHYYLIWQPVDSFCGSN